MQTFDRFNALHSYLNIVLIIYKMHHCHCFCVATIVGSHSGSGMFEGKTLLISGGTGSFGSAVLQRMIYQPFTEIRIFSRDEKKQEDQRLNYPDKRLRYYLGDVRDYRSIANAVSGVDFIFHAAALKQVPSCEFHPMEAVKTNILGTDNLLEAAIAASVARVVCLSTDKAVYPINAMGISKALMEKVNRRRAGESPTITTSLGKIAGSA